MNTNLAVLKLVDATSVRMMVGGVFHPTPAKVRDVKDPFDPAWAESGHSKHYHRQAA